MPSVRSSRVRRCRHVVQPSKQFVAAFLAEWIETIRATVRPSTFSARARIAAKAAPCRPVRRALAAAGETGLRRGEGLGLRWSDIDVDEPNSVRSLRAARAPHRLGSKPLEAIIATDHDRERLVPASRFLSLLTEHVRSFMPLSPTPSPRNSPDGGSGRPTVGSCLIYIVFG